MFNRRNFLLGASAGVLGGMSAPEAQSAPRSQPHNQTNPDSSPYTALAFAYGIVLDNPQVGDNWAMLSGVLANCTHEWHSSDRDATLRKIGQKVDVSAITPKRLNVGDLTKTMQMIDPDFTVEDMKATLAQFDPQYVPQVYKDILDPKIGMTAYFKASTMRAASISDQSEEMHPIAGRRKRPRAYLKHVQADGDIFRPNSPNRVGGSDSTGGSYQYCDPDGRCLGPGGQYTHPNPFCQANTVAEWMFGSAMLIIGLMAAYTDTFEFVEQWAGVAKAGGVGVAAWSQASKALC